MKPTKKTSNTKSFGILAQWCSNDAYQNRYPQPIAVILKSKFPFDSQTADRVINIIRYENNVNHLDMMVLNLPLSHWKKERLRGDSV